MLGAVLFLISCAGQVGGGSLGGGSSAIQNALDGGGVGGGAATGQQGGGGGSGVGDAEGGEGGGGGSGDGDAGLDGGIITPGTNLHSTPLDAGNPGPIEAFPNKADYAIQGALTVLCREPDNEVKVTIKGRALFREWDPVTTTDKFTDFEPEGVLRFIDVNEKTYVETELATYRPPENIPLGGASLLVGRKNSFSVTLSIKPENIGVKTLAVYYNPEAEAAENGEKSCPIYDYATTQQQGGPVKSKKPCYDDGALQMATFGMFFKAKSLNDLLANPQSVPVCTLQLIDNALQHTTPMVMD